MDLLLAFVSYDWGHHPGLYIRPIDPHALIVPGGKIEGPAIRRPASSGQPSESGGEFLLLAGLERANTDDIRLRGRLERAAPRRNRRQILAVGRILRPGIRTLKTFDGLLRLQLDLAALAVHFSDIDISPRLLLRVVERPALSESQRYNLLYTFPDKCRRALDLAAGEGNEPDIERTCPVAGKEDPFPIGRHPEQEILSRVLDQGDLITAVGGDQEDVVLRDV